MIDNPHAGLVAVTVALPFLLFVILLCKSLWELMR